MILTILHVLAILAAWAIASLMLIGLYYTAVDVARRREARRRQWRESRRTGR